MVKLGEIKVECVDKYYQLADPMTKFGASAGRLLAVTKSGAL